MSRNADEARAVDGSAVRARQGASPEMSPLWAPWFDTGTLRALDQHPLLLALSSGRVGLDGIRMLLIQHQHYSRHFTKYLCAVMSNVTDDADLRALVTNLAEEMGVSEGHVTHAELFQETLQALGVRPGAEPPLPATSALASTVLGHCRQKDPLAGVAALCLGAEAIVPFLYGPILGALTAHGLGERATEFFRVHLEEDEAHALTMLAILQRMTKGDPLARARARSIGAEVIARRCDMLEAVWQAVAGHEAPPAAPAGPPSTARFASGDFGRVGATQIVHVAERLLHREVTAEQSPGAAEFSGQRGHKVSIVDLPTATISVTIGELQPGQATRRHRHNYETVIYVIAGTGRSQIEDRSVSWTAGDAFYVPVWAAHQHFSDDAGPCTYLACENAPLLQNLGNIALREEL
jgi:pyrroloquinoline quinone (PQQ) biosynthesis protein C/quercetin dioxygenase-like cupin family protein